MKKICCFAGHSELHNVGNLYENLLSAIENLILTEDVNEFWVGNYGAFDKLSAKAVRELKIKYPKILLNLVVPYLTTGINLYKESYYKDYDEIITADIPKKTPAELRIIKCNQYMVKKSRFLICFVKLSFGGAAKTFEYAYKRKNIKIINLAE